MASKNETTNSPVHEFKVLHTGQRAFENPFLMVYYFLFITSKTFQALPFHFKDILQHFKFVNWRIRFLMSRTGYKTSKASISYSTRPTCLFCSPEGIINLQTNTTIRYTTLLYIFLINFQRLFTFLVITTSWNGRNF